MKTVAVYQQSECSFIIIRSHNIAYDVKAVGIAQLCFESRSYLATRRNRSHAHRVSSRITFILFEQKRSIKMYSIAEVTLAFVVLYLFSFLFEVVAGLVV